MTRLGGLTALDLQQRALAPRDAAEEAAEICDLDVATFLRS